MNTKDIQLSKSLSWILRHGAIKEKLKISPEGYISIQDILEHRSFKGKYNSDDIERVVCNNDKQRFKLRQNQSTNVLEIKANQGHSIQVDCSELTPLLEPEYKTVVHGTYFKFWPQIKTQGVSRMRRQHIHFSKGINDPKIISGLRRDVEIYIFIDLAKALAEGIQFYESDNGVILTDGDAKGYLEPKYFRKVIEVSTGYPIYTQPQDLIRIFSSYGDVKLDKMNPKYAVLAFSNEDEAKEAIQDSMKVNIYGEFLNVKAFSGRYEPSTPKREFARSKEKGKIIDPRTIELSGDFHSQLDAVLGAVRLAQGEVAALAKLYADLEAVLDPLWPGCGAMPFGSITTGLGIKTSDADCFISVPPALRHAHGNYVNKAKRALQQFPQTFSEILSIPRANTPIVKFFHVPTETNCDVTFKTPLGAQNSKLIAFLLHADPRLIPLAVLVKYWAKVHELTGTGRLSNYALTLLVIFYLQQPPVSILPSVQWLQRDSENDAIVDFWNSGFMDQHDLLPKSTNTSSIAELLGGFFQYYSTFRFDDMVVCPFMGTPIKKELFKDLNLLPDEFKLYVQNIRNRLVYPLKFTTPMCVQDPFELCHNVASAITNRLSHEIIAFFKFAATAYDKEKLNNCQDLLKTILLQKPKIPRGKLKTEFRSTIYQHLLRTIENPDWKSVVRDVTMQVFEEICKLKMTKVEEKENETGRKLKEKYASTITNVIWKRKQFMKFYNSMKIDLLERETRITEEVLKVEKELHNIKFHLLLTFVQDPRNVAISVKIVEGDANLFKDFGKFVIMMVSNWYPMLLKPYLKQREKTDQAENVTNVESSVGNKINSDENVNISVSQTENCDTSLSEDTADEEADNSGMDTEVHPLSNSL